MHTILTKAFPGRARAHPAPGRALHGRRLDGPLGGVVGTLLTWQERARQRHALAMLDERMRKDMGLTREQVLHEARKPFWRA